MNSVQVQTWITKKAPGMTIVDIKIDDVLYGAGIAESRPTGSVTVDRVVMLYLLSTGRVESWGGEGWESALRKLGVNTSRQSGTVDDDTFNVMLSNRPPHEKSVCLISHDNKTGRTVAIPK